MALTTQIESLYFSPSLLLNPLKLGCCPVWTTTQVEMTPIDPFFSYFFECIAEKIYKESIVEEMVLFFSSSNLTLLSFSSFSSFFS